MLATSPSFRKRGEERGNLNMWLWLTSFLIELLGSLLCLSVTEYLGSDLWVLGQIVVLRRGLLSCLVKSRLHQSFTIDLFYLL